MKTIATILMLLSVAASATAQRQMSFGKDGLFRIVQFTDTHLNQAKDSTDCVFRLISEVTAAERPELIVFTGDVVTERAPAEKWRKFVAHMDSIGLPWTVVFGNHDDEQGMTNAEIFELIRVSPTLVMEPGPEDVAGTGNFVIELLAHDSDRPANILYFLDSHSKADSQLRGIGGYGWIERSQIDWYRETAARYGGTPALAFFHIPLPEYGEALNGKEVKMTGSRNESVCSPRLNTGMFAAMKQCGDVQGIFVGHDHDNDYIANHHGIALAYGRFSGNSITTYGRLEPGARVIIVGAGEKSFETYIRLRGGEKINHCVFPESLK